MGAAPAAGVGAAAAADAAADAPADAAADAAPDAAADAPPRALARLASSGAPHELRDEHAGEAPIEAAQLQEVAALGEGGFATVAKAWYTPTDEDSPRRLVAVKRPKPAVFADPAQHELWAREVSLMRRLRHSCIVDFIGAGSGVATGDIERAFIVQELMEGGSLKGLVTRQMMQNPTPLYSDAAALDICLQIARGLRYLHSAQPMVIHRDLKLENIMLTSKGPSLAGTWTAKIADMGLSTTVAQKRAAKLQRLLSVSGGGAAGGKWRAAAAALGAARAMGARASSAPDAGGGQDTDGGVDAFSARSAKSEALWGARLQRLGSTAVGRSEADPAARLAGAVAAAAGVNEGAERWDLTSETGSLMYMSPEVFLGQPYNEKADVFSFGVVMYEVLHRYMTLSAICIRGTPEELEAYAASVAGGYRPPIQGKWPPELRALMEEVVVTLEDVAETRRLSTYAGQGTACCVIS